MNNNTKARFKQTTRKTRAINAKLGVFRKSKHAKVAYNNGRN